MFINSYRKISPFQIEKNVIIPLYDSSVSAGFPSPADDHLEKNLDLNEYLIKNPVSTFFVRVEGESMLGSGINSNDILIVDRSLEASNGKIIIAVISGELTVKRLRFSKNQIWLDADNENFHSIKVTEEMNFHIWGVVTNVIHKL
ncbi:MAG: translesion error-prone DNA polymerase V autoproteolytic subunit [Nitrospinota bacterium]|nr:translesion error-prone DNA polymerase V autoproteolytic subunit [Nitrospinota bacterium]